MVKFEVAEAATVNCYSTPEATAPESAVTPNLYHKAVRIAAAVLAAVLLAGAGYWWGRSDATTVCDSRRISVSGKGVVHNSQCPFYRKNQVRNCEYCGGISSR
ncbi:MAG: hypothetical protein HPZ91_05955 [Lentisphaeria bacterium]|nr:hypothetical protein [Lentisphaeria bacterium]